MLWLVLHYSCRQLWHVQWIVLSINNASYSNLTTIEFQHFRLKTGNCKEVLVFILSGWIDLSFLWNYCIVKLRLQWSLPFRDLIQKWRIRPKKRQLGDRSDATWLQHHTMIGPVASEQLRPIWQASEFFCRESSTSFTSLSYNKNNGR